VDGSGTARQQKSLTAGEVSAAIARTSASGGDRRTDKRTRVKLGQLDGVDMQSAGGPAAAARQLVPDYVGRPLVHGFIGANRKHSP